jgi:hypothetical protein
VRKSGQKVSGHSDVQTLIEQKTKLSLSLSNSTCRLGRQITENVIQEIEDNICSKSADRNAEIVKEYVQSMTIGTGNFSQLSMWKLKNKLFPNSVDPPMAKRDKYGTLISAPSLLKKLYLDTYTERLRNREIRPEITDLYEMKCELWNLQFEALKSRKSRPWEVSDLDKVLKKLKNNKTRDPQGLINEIFKPGVIGMDLKLAILNLFNGIKVELYFPQFLQFANITTIYKKKGSRQDLNNDRGIFVVSVLRMILDSLVYEEKYPEVDRNMSDSNIGARRDKNIRNHLFVVYGIINAVLNGRDSCMDIQIYVVE